MAKKRRYFLLKNQKKQNGQKFFCPFCAGNGKKIELKKIVTLSTVYIAPGDEVYEYEKKGNKFIKKFVRVENIGTYVTKRAHRLYCANCGLIYPISQFYKTKSSD